jgi:hypothetical protein
MALKLARTMADRRIEHETIGCDAPGPALTADGTIGSVTGITLQLSSPDGSWVPASNLIGTVLNITTLPNSVEPIRLPACNVRLALTGSGGSINASLVGLG